MKEPDEPSNEVARLEELRSFGILDTLTEEVYDDLVRLAAHIANTPIALVSLIDEDRQWFKARVGLDASQTPRGVSFCGHVVADGKTLVVDDSLADERFADNPLVVGQPQVRFYAGAPIVTQAGHVLGTLCVIDHQPRALDPEKVRLLEALARQVMTQLELRLEQKRQRRLLADLEVQQSFWSLSIELLCIANTEGYFEQLNPRWTELLGWSLDELRAEPFVTFMHPEDQEATQREALQVAQGVATVGFDNRFMTKDGRWLRLAWTARASRDGTKLLAVARDMTQWHATLAQLDAARLEAIEANRLKSAFLANMSHELRTPLNSVIGFANLLYNKSSALEGRELMFVDRIRKNGTHLLALINDVLDLSRIEADRLKVHLEDVELPELVRGVVEELEGRRVETGLSLSVVGLGDVRHPARADPLRLRQVLTNLVGNALKFTETGRVLVRVLTTAGQATAIEVVDTGIGIPTGEIDQIFEPFHQVEGGHERRFEGSGLGLAISRRLCRLQGFRLGVDSVRGEGATFRVDLSPERAG